jgi:hypothetical protein
MNEWEGFNFRNETLWRGRMLASTYVIRNALLEIGGWIGALVFAAYFDAGRLWANYNFAAIIALIMCVRMFSGALAEWRRLKSIEGEINTWMDHAEKLDDPHFESQRHGEGRASS